MLSEKPRSGLSETRKITKSTMEKKRRARINDSLTELKTILAGMVTHKGERFDKMEKADILELTVKCVRQLQKQANTSECTRASSRPEDNYQSGVNTCMSEVIRFISSSNLSDTDPEMKTKLLDHLANNLSRASQKLNEKIARPQIYENFPVNQLSPGSSVDDDRSRCPSTVSSDSNNNSHVVDNINNFQPAIIQVQAPTSPLPPLTSPLQPLTSPVFASYKPIQPVIETQSYQGQTNVPTVPLTILVPANFCSSQLGTTCVIPLNIQNTHPQVSQSTVLSGQVLTSHPFTSVAFTSAGAGLSLITSQSMTHNANQLNIVSSSQSNNSSLISYTAPSWNDVSDDVSNIQMNASAKTVVEKLSNPSGFQKPSQTSPEFLNIHVADKGDVYTDKTTVLPVRQFSPLNEAVSSRGTMADGIQQVFTEKRPGNVAAVYAPEARYAHDHSYRRMDDQIASSSNLNTRAIRHLETSAAVSNSRIGEQDWARNDVQIHNNRGGEVTRSMWRPW